MPDVRAVPDLVTERDIHAILGPIDDEMVFIIQETGASRDEVLQAFMWLNDDDYIGGELKRPISNRVRAVYEILFEAQELAVER